MKLRRVELENFRGITELDLELTDTTVLIGENNTGKTAILDAMRYALREVRTRHGCSFDSYDFHLPEATSEPAAAPPVSIRLTFREDHPNEWGNQKLGRLNRAKILQVDAAGCAAVILKVGARYDGETREFAQDWEFQNLDGAPLSNVSDQALSVLHNEVSYFYLAALRDAARHFDAKGTFWRPFLRDSQLPDKMKTEIETKLSEVNELIISSHASFTQVVSRLSELSDVVSFSGNEDFVSVDAVPGRVFDMLAKAQVSLTTGTGAMLPIGRHGEGTQSLAVLALFNAFLQAWNNGDPIVALEEPEAHLHPSAVRALWQLIERIPGQKIITSHSGDLLSEVPSQAVTRLHRDAGVVTATRLQNAGLDADETRKFDFHIRQSRGELLFARCWILGEGETDAMLITEIARVLGRDLLKAGVRFVTYQTGVSLQVCLRVANSLGIKWVVLADNDDQGDDSRDAVINHLGARPESEALFMMAEKNIEEHLCQHGFSDVYWGCLSHQSRQRVTAQPHQPDYPIQVARALPKKHKIPAAQEVLSKIRSGERPVPEILRNVIEAALLLAEGR